MPRTSKSDSRVSKPTTVAEYLRAVPIDKRRALERLRKIIRSVVPDVEEAISYGMPGFRWQGRWVIWIGAGAEHCALYGVTSNSKELAAYETSGRGTVRFAPDDPLPEALVRKLVLTNFERVQAKGTTKPKRATKGAAKDARR